MERPDVKSVICDQCCFGQTTTGPVGKGVRPARKRTKFASNAMHILEQLDRRCEGSHQHMHLVNGRAKKMEEYTKEMTRAICIGLKRQLKDHQEETKCLFKLSAEEAREVHMTPEEEANEDLVKAWDDVSGK